jgi:hypothetical protein
MLIAALAGGLQIGAERAEEVHRIASVPLVLFDQQVLGSGGGRSVDDLVPVEVAIADLGELDEI